MTTRTVSEPGRRVLAAAVYWPLRRARADGLLIARLGELSDEDLTAARLLCHRVCSALTRVQIRRDMARDAADRCGWHAGGARRRRGRDAEAAIEPYRQTRTPLESPLWWGGR